MRRVAFVALAALLLAGAAPNWTATVRQQDNGAYVLGNPAAAVKLVEYLSYTCGHCAHFAGESKAPLRTAYVARGLVSVELRNAVRDRFDFTAALLARCGGPSRFHANSEAIFAAQAAWMGRIEAFQAANGAKLAGLAINDSLKLIARGVGLDAILRQRGYSAAQIDACLTSKPEQERVAAMANEAWNVRKIKGTPFFLINGAPVDGVGNWAGLEPKLKASAMAVR